MERNGSSSNASRSPYCSRLRLAPGPYRITLRRHYFNCVLRQSLPQRLRNPAAYGACWAVEQPSAAETSSVRSARTLPDLLTPDEVAAWLRTTVKAVYAKAERGTLPGATRVGRRLYFLRADLLRLVEQGRVPHLGGPGGGT